CRAVHSASLYLLLRLSWVAIGLILFLSVLSCYLCHRQRGRNNPAHEGVAASSRGPSREGLPFGANLFSWRSIGTSRFRGALFIARISATYGEPDSDPGHKAFDEQETKRRMQIIVRDNNVDQALRALKKKLQREGVYREMKLRRHYEKPSEKRARER